MTKKQTQRNYITKWTAFKDKDLLTSKELFLFVVK